MHFHEYDFIGHHMMDIEFGSWIYIIIGIGVIFLSVIVLTYILIHYNNVSNSKSQLRKEKYESNAVKSNADEVERIDSREANFCHNCGHKLIDKFVKFCPYCGERI